MMSLQIAEMRTLALHSEALFFSGVLHFLLTLASVTLLERLGLKLFGLVRTCSGILIFVSGPVLASESMTLVQVVAFSISISGVLIWTLLSNEFETMSRLGPSSVLGGMILDFLLRERMPDETCEAPPHTVAAEATPDTQCICATLTSKGSQFMSVARGVIPDVWRGFFGNASKTSVSYGTWIWTPDEPPMDLEASPKSRSSEIDVVKFSF